MGPALPGRQAKDPEHHTRGLAVMLCSLFLRYYLMKDALGILETKAQSYLEGKLEPKIPDPWFTAPPSTSPSVPISAIAYTKPLSSLLFPLSLSLSLSQQDCIFFSAFISHVESKY
jgi:hypothetical protein